jgi:hypothetical protein
VRRLLVAAALLAAALVPTSSAHASPRSLVPALTPDAPAFAAYPVEGFASYDPQRTCTRKPRVGTVELGEYLVATYGGSGGAVNRSCAGTSVSEHKDGRAVDWTLDAAVPADQALAQEFLDDVLAPDAAGEPAALARRMGIMYLIWDDTMYAAYDGFAPRRYRSSSCRSVRTCSPTLRHRDHVHISLSKAGAKARTSFYTVLARS